MSSTAIAVGAPRVRTGFPIGLDRGGALPGGPCGDAEAMRATYEQQG